jgi:MoxR-like ATPase
MKIQTNSENYLISPMETEKHFGIKTSKFIVIDKNTFDFVIQDSSAYTQEGTWIDEEIDGRKFRKVKKNIVAEFGDILLNEYKNSDKIYEVISKKFINMSGPSQVIKNALANNMNLILYGKGGFGKSEVCDELFSCAELKDRVFIKSLSEATTVEDLFGGINIKKMTDTGSIEYNCENSFANKEIVIFEEIFDANPQVLAALKDTLTSKEIRNGNQRFPIKTQIIIGLTNKTYEEVIEDDSTEALTQRFAVSYPFQYKIDKLNSASLILNRYPDFGEDKLAAMIDTIAEMKDLSPRKILEMSKYIKNMDIIKNRNYSEKITNNLMTPVVNYLKTKSGIDVYKSLFNEVVTSKKAIRDGQINDYDSFVDTRRNLEIIKSITSISKTSISSSTTKEIEELLTILNKQLS